MIIYYDTICIHPIDPRGITCFSLFQSNFPHKAINTFFDWKRTRDSTYPLSCPLRNCPIDPVHLKHDDSTVINQELRKKKFISAKKSICLVYQYVELIKLELYYETKDDVY